MEEERHDPCRVCRQTRSRYTCPRCDLRYCSAACYRHAAHAACSEAFYKHEFMEELQRRKADPSERQRVLAMLQRLEAMPNADLDALLHGQLQHKEAEEGSEAHAEDSGSDEDLGEHGGEQGGEQDEQDEQGDPDVLRLQALLQRLEAGPSAPGQDELAALLAHLTKQEQQQFEALLANGQLGADLPTWVPWWQGVEPPLPALVAELDAPGPCDTLLLANGRSVAATLAALPEPLQPLAALLHGRPPAASLANDLVSVLVGYAYIVRLFNGDAEPLARTAADALLQACGCLREPRSFPQLEAALGDFWLAATTVPALQSAPDQALQALHDAATLLRSAYFVMGALAEALALVHSALRLGDREDRAARKRLQAAARKLYFFACWWHERLAGDAAHARTLNATLSQLAEAVAAYAHSRRAERRAAV